MAASRDYRHFFVSFNDADLAYAAAIDAALRDAGFTTYFHPRDLGPGGNVPIWMDEALLNSAQTLALYSPDYTKDAAIYSKAERYASFWQDPTGDKRKLIPIVIRETTFTPLLAMVSRITVAGMTPEEAAAHVVARLKSDDETAAGDSWRRSQPLPAIFTAAYRPNPNFTGRFEALGNLIKCLRIGTNAAVVTIAGMGGVGKTTLAAEYCHRFGGRYGGVWWVRAEQQLVMLADLQALGQRLGIPSTGNIEADARTALDHLASLSQPWLMIYDNAPNPDAVRNWLPIGAVRCIITSRFTEFGDIAPVTCIDVWSHDVTAAYLLSRTGRDDNVGATRLAKRIGGLPLAAEQAAAYLSPRLGISFDEYGDEIARLIKQPRPVGARGEYPATVYAAFAKSLETAQGTKTGEAALDFIRICAFLSPDGVDVALLEVSGGQQVLPASLVGTLADKVAREDALTILTSLSLMRRDEGPFGPVLIFHRLLLETVRDWMGEEGRSLWGSSAVRLIAGVFPGGEVHADPSCWPRCALLLPHIAPLGAHAPQTSESVKALAHVLSQASLYLCARGDRIGALVLADQSVVLSRIIADDPLALAVRLNNLGTRCLDLNHLMEAEKAFLEALHIEEPLLAPNDPSLAVTLSNIAAVYRERKEFAEAEALYCRAAKITMHAKGAMSAEYGLSLSNLGTLYGEWSEQTGEATRMTQAERCLAEALTITLAARGERHPESATRHHNLATLKWKTDDKDGAVAEAERALAIRLSLDLMVHPDTRRAANNLIHYLENSGGHDKAARMLAGDISYVLPLVAEIEAEHRTWVAKDPTSRDFGPPSRFGG
jgi:hypothetical protein